MRDRELDMEGIRMRRTTRILMVCLSVVAGCRGSAAQEPYDGMVASGGRPAKPAAIPAADAPQPEPIASATDVEWTIALLSNAKTRAGKKAGNVIVVESEPDAPEPAIQELDLHVAVDPGEAEEKPATPKTCNGVVVRRS
jgi:hypothetical protein